MEVYLFIQWSSLESYSCARQDGMNMGVYSPEIFCPCNIPLGDLEKKKIQIRNEVGNLLQFNKHLLNISLCQAGGTIFLRNFEGIASMYIFQEPVLLLRRPKLF